MATPQPTQPTAALKPKKKLFQRRIPTLLGIVVLLVGIVGGIMVFENGGTGVFAPRATPQTTPKKIHITNVTDSSFTISFFTDEATTGFIKYGKTEDQLKSQASDDRDQLSGSISPYNLHHITVRGLEPNTTYYYTLGTSSGTQFDNSGTPFTTKTAVKGGVPPAARTIYGSVVAPTGNPAEGSIVYVSIEGAGEQSSLVKSSGSWAIPLSTARTTDGSAYAQITDSTTITILAQGGTANLTSQITTTVAAAQPVSTITLGESANTTAQTQTTTASNSAVALTSQTTNQTSTSSESADLTSRGGLNDLLSGASASAEASDSAEATASATVDLVAAAANPNEVPVVTTTQPKITGTAVPNVVVTIEVHSETNIQTQLTTDANGQFVLDISKMSETLEPGPHTVTYSYVDPTTGQTITKTQNFTVAPRSTTGTQIAAVTPSPSPTPYGSGNPYPVGGATASANTSTSSTKVSTSSSRVSIPSTSSGVPVSGSVSTTLSLVIGGLFFMFAGGWSYWIAQQLSEE